VSKSSASRHIASEIANKDARAETTAAMRRTETTGGQRMVIDYGRYFH